MKKIWKVVILCAIAVCALRPAAAPAFTCTPSAIHAKSQYVMGMWKWLDSSASDNAAASVYQSKLSKVWDGNGDCSGDEDMSAFPDQTRIDLMRVHFYGDMMTVPFAIGAKDYKLARTHMDDWLEADAIIRKHKDTVDDQMVADDARQRDQMLQFNARLSKLGYPSSYKP